jgi:hypothetical protein
MSDRCRRHVQPNQLETKQTSTNLEFLALLDSDLRAGHFAQPGLSEQGHFLLFTQRIGRSIGHVIGTNFICFQTQIREEGPSGGQSRGSQ